MNVAVIGATGVVGRKVLQILEQRNFYADNYYLFASKKSRNTTIEIFNEKLTVEELNEESLFSKKIDLAFFCAGSKVSEVFAPTLSETGTYVIDNSSAFRLFDNVPLVVPEVNDYEISANRRLIANPNCSTIMLAPILHCLKSFGLNRVTVCTYQAVSGAGMRGISDLKKGEKGIAPNEFEKEIYSNCIPKIGTFNDDFYSEEEMKIIRESKKILDLEKLNISATAVRVPVFNCHAEAVNIILNSDFTLTDIFNALKNVSYVKAFEKDYPTQKEADGSDLITVGRIRKDFSADRAVWMWIVSDNLRTGAALNAVKIAEILRKRSIIDL